MSTERAELRKTTCNRDCPDACGIVATVEDGKIVRIQGDKAHPVTQGFLCFRTSRYLETHQYSPSRLTRPLLRKDGELVPVSMDEALDFAARELMRIRAESGPAAIFHYRSGGSLGLLKTLSDHFFEQLGPVTVKRGDICSGAGDHAQTTDFGHEDSHDLFDLLDSKQIILWGKNIFTSNIHAIPVIKEARRRGAGVVLIDPVSHRTRSIADAYHQVRPAGDFALAMAVARVLFERGWTDPRAAEYVKDLDAFREMAFARSTEGWCAEADLPVSAAVDLAERLGPGKPAAILVGWGMGRRVNGSAIVRALDALCAISGNLGIAGGGVSFYFKRRAAFDTSFVRGVEVAPRSIPEPMFGPAILAAKDPPIRAVWITAGNPVDMLPESLTTAEALRTRELVVVVDTHLTDTAKLATLVLPTRTLLEDDDLVGAYGHHWIAASRPVVDAPPGVLSDLEIIQAVAERVGLGAVMAGDARSWKRKLCAPLLGPRGVGLEQLEAGAVKSPLARKVLFEDRVFPTASGKVELITALPPAAEEVPGFPLVLMSLSTERAQSSQWAVEEEGPIEVTVHPEASGGIPDGAVARLESSIAAIPVRVRHDPSQRRDVALTPKGGHLAKGRATNALLRARLTDGGEGGALYDERVRLVAL